MGILRNSPKASPRKKSTSLHLLYDLEPNNSNGTKIFSPKSGKQSAFESEYGEILSIISHCRSILTFTDPVESPSERDLKRSKLFQLLSFVKKTHKATTWRNYTPSCVYAIGQPFQASPFICQTNRHLRITWGWRPCFHSLACLATPASCFRYSASTSPQYWSQNSPLLCWWTFSCQPSVPLSVWKPERTRKSEERLPPDIFQVHFLQGIHEEIDEPCLLALCFRDREAFWDRWAAWNMGKHRQWFCCPTKRGAQTVLDESAYPFAQGQGDASLPQATGVLC